MTRNDQSDTLRRSGKGLIENIVRFSDLLRENGISVSLPAILDSIKGLPLIDISNLDAFRCLLRANFVSRKKDIQKFNSLFYAYWLPPDRFKIQRSLDKRIGGSDENPDTPADLEEKMAFLETTASTETSTGANNELAMRYSPEPLADARQIQALGFDESKALTESINRLLQPLANRLSRRFQYILHGKEISLRKILRKNMQFGGELILLDFKKKKLKKRRVIFFCDVSGSMDIYTLLVLQFIHALKRLDRRTEIFFFSTDLSRGTRQFDVGDFSTAIAQMPELITDWGGGTRIGHCLKIFNETFGKAQLSSKDIIMMFSDGWDRGEMDVLEDQMAFLKQKAYKIIWLNPLSGSLDYQPTCQGMRTALPYVDYLLPLGSLQDLRFVKQTLENVMI